MADNTLVEFPGVTTVEPPHQTLTKGMVAEPYMQLAEGLSEAGRAFTDVSETQAEREGAVAVRTGDDGKLVVDQKPLIVGPASEIYDKTVRMTIANRSAIDTQNNLLQMRQDVENDPSLTPNARPAAYQARVNAYMKTQSQLFSKDPLLQQAITQDIAQVGGQNYRSVLVQSNNEVNQEFLTATKAKIEQAADQRASLARDLGTHDPAYLRAAQQYDAAVQTLVNHPATRGTFPQATADQMIETQRSEDIGQAVIGASVQMFNDPRDKPAASKFLHEQLYGPGSQNLRLSPQQKDKIYTEGLRALDLKDTVDKQALANNISEVNKFHENMVAAPETFTQQRFDELMADSERLGDENSLTKLRRVQPWLETGTWQHWRSMTPDERLDWMRNPTAPAGVGAPPSATGGGNYMHGQYGAPGENLTTIRTPGGASAQVNRAAAPAFQGFLTDLEKAGAPLDSLGGYSYRTIAGSNRISQHGYGNAIDVDQVSRNVVSPAFRDWAASHQDALRQAQQKWQIISGGDWRNPDFGHFEWSPGPQAGQQRRDTIDTVVDGLTRGGMSMNATRAMVASGQLESGMDPGQITRFDNKQYFMDTRDAEGAHSHGIWQLNADTWKDYTAWIARNHPGGNWADPGLQAEFMPQYLKEKYPRTFEAMNNAATPEAAAEAFTREFEKPRDIPGRLAKLQNIGTPESFYAGGPGGGVNGAAMTRGFEESIAIMRRQIGEDATNSARAIKDDFKAGRPLSQPQVDQFLDQVQMSGKNELLKGPDGAAKEIEASGILAAIKPGMSPEAATSALEADALAEPDPIRRQAYTAAAEQHAKWNAEMQQDPLSYGTRAGWTAQPLGQLDTANPQNFAGEIVQRAKGADLIRQRVPSIGPISVIGAGEKPAVANALLTGDPGRSAQVLGVLQQALADRPDDLVKTFGGKDNPLNKALSGMAYSGDPNRFKPAMEMMEVLERTDKMAFGQNFSKEAGDALHTWLARKNDAAPAQIAADLARWNDPNQETVRKGLETKADALLSGNWFSKGLGDPGKIFGSLPSVPWYQRWLGLGGGLPQYGAVLPAGTVQTSPSTVPSQVMAAEASNTFKTLFVNGATEDAAKEQSLARLADHWAPSPVNGGRVMQFPPEKVRAPNGDLYYPPVAGSQDWIGRQLDRLVLKTYGEKVVGRGFGAGIEGGLQATFPEAMPLSAAGAEIRVPRAQRVGVAADEQTEGEANAGNRGADGNLIGPSFIVTVMHDGQLEVLADKDGPIRWRPNPNDPIVHAEARQAYQQFRERRQRAQADAEAAFGMLGSQPLGGGL